MKVPDIKGLYSIARTMLDPKKAQQAVERASQTGKTADQVELSSQSQTVHKLAADRTDERSRAALVAELKAQYDRGELKPDSEGTASAMVAHGLFDDILGTQQ